MNDAALVLCPRNMTAPLGGPEGFLGDRIHQLPAVRRVAEQFRPTFFWPADSVTGDIFPVARATPLDAQTPEAAAAALAGGVRAVFGLYADPTGAPAGEEPAGAHVRAAHAVAAALARRGAELRLPDTLDPRGRVPLWRRLYALVEPGAATEGSWPSPPILEPDGEARRWAERTLAALAQGRPVLVLSPFSGGAKGALPLRWWRSLAAAFAHGEVVVPFREPEEGARARRLFRDMPHVHIVHAPSALQVAALAARPEVRAAGVDGGRTCNLAAASTRGVLAVFGPRWPASAWALPSMSVFGPKGRYRLTPEEAMLLLP